MKKRDHSWSDPIELEKGYSLEHMNGNTYEGRFKTVAATQEDAELSGFLSFISSLTSIGVYVPKTLRRANDGNEGGREGEGT